MAKFSFFLLAAPLVAAGAIAPASAQTEDEQSVTVRYDDLDLSSALGRERLTSRVRIAVRQICDPYGRRTLVERASSRQCAADAMRNADTRLAELFNGNGAQLADRGRIVVAAP